MGMLRTFLRLAAANALPQRLLSKDVDIATARRLFRQYVKIVNIENHSYCNRTCSFCPNSFIDRHSKNIRLDPVVYRKILGDLAAIGFDQALIWGGYHEPLADSSIYGNIATARKVLPNAYLRIYTNGDYLTAQAIRDLELAGLDQIRVSLYPNPALGSSEGAFASQLEGLARKTGLRVGRLTQRYQGLQLVGSACLVLIDLQEFKPRQMSSRGGALADVSGLRFYQRTLICFNPLQHLAITFDGKCMLCCQTRADVSGHLQAVIGDLKDPGYSLFHYYRDLAPHRAALLGSGPKGGVCKMCDVNPGGGGPFHAGRDPVVSKVLNAFPLVGELMGKLWCFPREDRRRYEWF